MVLYQTAKTSGVSKMNIIFDIGNVLIDYKPAPFLESLFPEKELVEKMLETVFYSTEWEYMDQGILTHGEATDIFCFREPEYEQAIRKTMQNIYTIFTPMPDTIGLLPRIKEMGHDLYYLSNIHAEIRDYLLAEHQFFELFVGGVYSCDIKKTKPTPGIYRHLLEQYSLVPGECLFFDDAEKNVIAAQNEGIRSVVFTSSSCVIQNL